MISIETFRSKHEGMSSLEIEDLISLNKIRLSPDDNIDEIFDEVYLILENKQEMEIKELKEIGLRKAIRDNRIDLVKAFVDKSFLFEEKNIIIPDDYCPCCAYDPNESSILLSVLEDKFDIFELLVKEINSHRELDFVKNTINCNEYLNYKACLDIRERHLNKMKSSDENKTIIVKRKPEKKKSSKQRKNHTNRF